MRYFTSQGDLCRVNADFGDHGQATCSDDRPADKKPLIDRNWKVGAGMLHAVMLGSGPGRGRREWYPGFYLQRRRLGCRMNRGEQETLFRQSRQITRIVPSREDLVLSVLKSPINQQQQQRQQCRHPYQSHTHGHFNCQDHPNNKRCSHSGTRLKCYSRNPRRDSCSLYVYIVIAGSNIANERDVDNYSTESRCICCTL